MESRIELFYKENNIPPVLLKQKLLLFNRNSDIASEFEYWIEHRQYVENECVVEGYSASKLAAESEYLNGEGAFIMLIELRENPDKALKRIKAGFKRK